MTEPVAPKPEGSTLVEPTQPEQKTTPPPQPVGKWSALAIVALIIGIVGILTMLVPFVGLALGIAAVILAIVARKKSPEQKKWLPGLITGSIATVMGLGVLVLLGLGLLLSGIGTAVNGEQGKEYQAQVQTITNAKKDFTKGEVAEFGPYDVTVVSSEPYYQPTAEEQAIIDEKYEDIRRDTSSGKPVSDWYGYGISDENAQYASVVLNVRYNEERAAQYDTLSPALKGWSEEFSGVTLEDMRSLRDVPDELDSYRVPEEAKTAEGVTVPLLFRIDKTTASPVLTYEMVVFTKTSSIVGTEGMPSKEFIYSIQL